MTSFDTPRHGNNPSSKNPKETNVFSLIDYPQPDVEGKKSEGQLYFFTVWLFEKGVKIK